MTKEEIDNLILNNTGLCYDITWKYYKKYADIIEFEDLLGICNVGLVKAANTYDKDKGFTFATYCYKVVQNEIFMYLKDNKRKNKFNIDFVSINASVDLDKKLSFEDVLPQDYDLEEEVENNLILNLLYKFINELPNNLKEVLYYRLEGKTQKEIGEMLKLSQAQISRLQSIAINKLRYKFRKEGML